MRQTFFALALLGSSHAFGQPNQDSKELEFYDFLDQLYQDVEVGYANRIREGYNTFIEELDLCDSEGNRNIYGRISFLHKLITSDYSENGASIGLLYVPYMWHWIDDNPRLEISRNGKLLKETTASNGKYASAAMVDRTPQIFLADMVSDQPYSHPEYGEFYTFGWCSEREMAYVNMLNHWGISAKVIVDGAHSYTVVNTQFDRVGGVKEVFVKVDNTYDEIRGSSNKMDGDGGKLERWYNASALKEVKATVSVNAQKRIYKAILSKEPSLL